MKSIDFLLENSNLPGPRGNLELLYKFSKTATEAEINECFRYYSEDLKNSPEEFVVMCGILGYCYLHHSKIENTLSEIRKFASHASWRVRESVAMGIQELGVTDFEKTVNVLENWKTGNQLELRAVVAGLCEPKLLKMPENALKVLEILEQIIITFNKIPEKLTPEGESLRKALGYGLSVAMVHLPEKGKELFEKLETSKNKHILWILRENLKKNRLLKMDPNWVEEQKMKV
ncbi:MAG: hypothetical protein LCH67_12580 [Bacteroidetes bacterium]|nr:hypothetical protein [Bacteroidota bacterium]